jgi:hypothetical protein
MPKSGQTFDPRVFERSALFREFAELTPPIAALSGWPTLDWYSEFADEQRRTRAPELGRVSFARSSPARGRGAEPLDISGLYDGRIALRGEVPCLEGSYHDLFNVLVWAAFPRSKRALHARQFQALRGWIPSGASRLPNRRTREQDALTIFDEGGAILIPAAKEADLLPAGAEPGADSVSRASATPTGARVTLFGHAVMEHVCFEKAPVYTAALVLALGDEGEAARGTRLLDQIDRTLAQRLSNPGEFCSPAFDATLGIEPPERWCRLPPSASGLSAQRA